MAEGDWVMKLSRDGTVRAEYTSADPALILSFLTSFFDFSIELTLKSILKPHELVESVQWVKKGD